MMRRMLFFRDFQAYSGGHGKVFDWYQHIAQHPRWQCAIHFSAQSRLDEGNPWMRVGVAPEPVWDARHFDAVFMAGLDWQHVTPPPGTPVLQLVQHVRHADPMDPRYEFLKRPALRVCVSSAVQQAVVASGCANGPVRLVQNGIDVAALSAMAANAIDKDVFIDAIKATALGGDLARELASAGISCTLLCQPIPRPDYLRGMSAHRIAVVLPHAREGFYLPALEAMAMGRTVVTLDALGNRDYLDAGGNAEVVAANAGQLRDRVLALLVDASRCAALARAAQATARHFDLARERKAVHALLDELVP